jgi:hypothetical protein
VKEKRLVEGEQPKKSVGLAAVKHPCHVLGRHSFEKYSEKREFTAHHISWKITLGFPTLALYKPLVHAVFPT